MKTKEQLYTSPDIFMREYDDPSTTSMVVGRSYSGKTHFLVSELNKLAGKTRIQHGVKRPIYDQIFLFTESVDATPLANLDSRVKVTLIRGYLPKVIMLLKKVQDYSKNNFRFLVILDDVVSNIRQGIFLKQILTMRNAHISTCILLQYVKLITPAQRNSIHHMYITGLKPEEYEYLLQGFLSSHARDAVGNIRSIPELSNEFHKWIGTDIVFYDQRRDKFQMIQRDEYRN